MATGVENFHPLYTGFLEDWQTMRDCFQGERVVKAQSDKYLPPTPSMILDGFFSPNPKSIGRQIYNGYKKRAHFPDYVKEGVEILVGMLHHKPPTIELPIKMQPMLVSCTLDGEGLEALLRKINTEQLLTGRVGALADLPSTADPTENTQTVAPTTASTVPLPYLATYVAESIINWDDASFSEGFRALNLVIMDESGFKRGSEFEWRDINKFRVLILGAVATNEPNKQATYQMGVFEGVDGKLTFDQLLMKTPMYMGASLQQIPFVFIGTKDLTVNPDNPPLLGLSKLVLNIYRGDADYRQGLFMQGQDTLVVVGGTRLPNGEPGAPGDEDALRTGAGSRIDVEINGDAKYIGVESQGLAEQRLALAADHQRAATRSGQLLPTGKSGTQESGEALKTRLAAQTASLTQIAITGAKGLETLLKTVAVWIGANPDEVKVTPNLEFGELQMSSQDLGYIMSAKLQGLPLSKKSLHQTLVEKRLTTMTFEEETQQIEEENAQMPPPPGAAGAPEPAPNPLDNSAPGNKPPGTNKSKVKPNTGK